MTFEEWKQLPYVRTHFIAPNAILKTIFDRLSEEKRQEMKDESN